MLKLDSLGRTYPSSINGMVFNDLNEDCQLQNEAGLGNWFLNLSGDWGTYTQTDRQGHFYMEMPEGDYELRAIARSPYWESCLEAYPFSVDKSENLAQNVAVWPSYDCPYLEVDVGTTLLRRCFENTYTVRYCNHGTEVAEGAFVEVELDPALQFLSCYDACNPRRP